MTRRSDEDQIREIIDSQHQALTNKDIAGALEAFDSDPANTMYTLAPPLRSQNHDAASAAAAVEEWLDAWESGPEFETRDLAIIVSGDLGYSTGFVHMTGQQNGERSDIWYRRTSIFRKIEAEWKIVHDHESVPFYMDGSSRAATDLTP